MFKLFRRKAKQRDEELKKVRKVQLKRTDLIQRIDGQ